MPAGRIEDLPQHLQSKRVQLVATRTAEDANFAKARLFTGLCRFALIRGRATGWVAGCSKFGGLVAQLLSIFVLVPTLGLAGAGILVPTLLSVGLIARFGAETRGRDLRELDAAATAE